MLIATGSSFAVAESIPQVTADFITDIPGKVIYRVRTPDVQINTIFTKHGIPPTGHLHSENLGRG